MLADTHCHLNFNTFESDLEDVLDRAVAIGVNRILIPGTDLPSSRSAVMLANRYPMLFASIGIHPNDTAAWDDNWLKELSDLADSPKVVAIGEIGLDYYRDRSPKESQRHAFQEQLSLAGQKGLPVVIHCRDAFEDIWMPLEKWVSYLESHNGHGLSHLGVFHSFDGDLDMAQRAMNDGFLIGITGPVTYKNAANRQQIACTIPIEKLLTETDSPFLTPHPHRGKRNEPAYVALVAGKIAELHQLPFENVATITSQNADALFSWRAFD